MNFQPLIRRIQSGLTEDLLHPAWRGKGSHRLSGHCYVASEALYHLGAREVGFRPARLPCPGGTHWFLIDDQGRVLDPTAGQFDQTPRYQEGRRSGFLTKRPSRRARTLMGRVTAAFD